MKYLNGLARQLLKKEERFLPDPGTEITKKEHTANGYKIRASHIVVATNTPVNDIVTMHTKQFPYRSYVIAATIPKGLD